MFRVLVIEENGNVEILLAIFLVILAAVLTAFLKNKSAQKAITREATEKANRADIMQNVNDRIHEELKPVSDRMNKHDQDFKEFKKEEIGPMKEKVSDLEKKVLTSDLKLDNLAVGIGDIKDLIGSLFNKLDGKQDKK